MKLIKYIAIIAILLVVIYINFNKDTPLWDLMYYMQSYLFVGFFIYIGFEVSKDVLTRSILIALGFYYSYELIVDIIKVIDPVFGNYIYITQAINYILALVCGGSLLILPLYNKIKKCISS